MAIHVVEVTDKITIRRRARLLIASAEPMAGKVAIDRAVKGVDVTWDEEQIDAQPYEAALCQADDDVEMIALLVASLRPAGLDQDERIRFDTLLLTSGIEHGELRRFSDRCLPDHGSNAPADDGEPPEPTQFRPTCPDMGACDNVGICRTRGQMLDGEAPVDPPSPAAAPRAAVD